MARHKETQLYTIKAHRTRNYEEPQQEHKNKLWRTEFHTYIYILMLNSMMKKESQAWIQNGNPAEQTIQKQMGGKKKFVGHDEVRGYFDAICVNSEVPIRGHLKLVMKKVFDLLPHLAPFYREMPWRVTVPILARNCAHPFGAAVICCYCLNSAFATPIDCSVRY